MLQLVDTINLLLVHYNFPEGQTVELDLPSATPGLTTKTLDFASRARIKASTHP